MSRAEQPVVPALAAGLRERNRLDVRDRLIRSALALFAGAGFEATTIDAIAQGAGVSRRTFFRYFPTKEDVVLARREEQLARFRAALRARPPGEGAFAAVRRGFEELAADYAAQRRRILAERALFDAAPSLHARDRELDRDFEDAVAAALAEGGDAAVQRRARLCAAAVVGVLRVVLEEWATSRGRADLAAHGREAMDLVEPLAPGPTAGAVRRPGATRRPSSRRRASRPG